MKYSEIKWNKEKSHAITWNKSHNFRSSNSRSHNLGSGSWRSRNFRSHNWRSHNLTIHVTVGHITSGHITVGHISKSLHARREVGRTFWDKVAHTRTHTGTHTCMSVSLIIYMYISEMYIYNIYIYIYIYISERGGILRTGYLVLVPVCLLVAVGHGSCWLGVAATIVGQSFCAGTTLGPSNWWKLTQSTIRWYMLNKNQGRAFGKNKKAPAAST